MNNLDLSIDVVSGVCRGRKDYVSPISFLWNQVDEDKECEYEGTASIGSTKTLPGV